jgi:hypothetical protein
MRTRQLINIKMVPGVGVERLGGLILRNFRTPDIPLKSGQKWGFLRVGADLNLSAFRFDRGQDMLRNYELSATSKGVFCPPYSNSRYRHR